MTKKASKADLAYILKWQKVNPDKRKRARDKWRTKNPQYNIEYGKVYRKENVTKCQKGISEWQKRFPHKNTAKSNKYRVNKLKAAPKWIDEALVMDIYAEAEYQQMEVDHIIPLKNKIVCGLHWEGNLQLLTKEANCRKGNRHNA